MIIGKMFVLTYANGPIMLFRPTCIYILKKKKEKKEKGGNNSIMGRFSAWRGEVEGSPCPSLRHVRSRPKVVYKPTNFTCLSICASNMLFMKKKKEEEKKYL